MLAYTELPTPLAMTVMVLSAPPVGTCNHPYYAAGQHLSSHRQVTHNTASSDNSGNIFCRFALCDYGISSCFGEGCTECASCTKCVGDSMQCCGDVCDL